MANGNSGFAQSGRVGMFVAAAILIGTLYFPLVALAQQAPTGNQIMGELAFVATTKAEKTAGVWVDGQYVGFVKELKDNKKVLLLPGAHDIAVRQTGYLELTADRRRTREEDHPDDQIGEKPASAVLGRHW